MKQKQFFYGSYTRKLVQLGFLLFILNLTVQAQNGQVTGKIYSNQSDTAVSGATVTVKGTKKGVAAGADGSFSVAASTNATLVVTAIGYAPQEVPLNGQSSITVHL